MKRKTLTLCLCLLAIFSLVGIGFAAWQIAKPATATPVDGTVVAYDATETNATIQMGWKEGKNQFIFGLPTDYSTPDSRSYKWFSLTDAANMQKDNHTVTLDIEVGSASALIDGSKIVVYLKPTDVTAFNEVFNDVIANKINDKDLDYDSDDDEVFDSILIAEYTKDQLTANASQSINITTGWGTAFGSDNPYTVFGSQAYDATNSNHTGCTANLDKLFNNLSNLGFQLVIKNTEPEA